jgi:DNA-binding transcriptional MerR regulator
MTRRVEWIRVKERITAMREKGVTLQDIADQLNAEGVPPPRRSGKWRPWSVQRELRGGKNDPGGRAA